MEEHLGLQLCLQETSRRLRTEERRSKGLEERKNPINLALAERIGQLEAELESLQRTVSELREENDHLEFRLLEMDELPIKVSQPTITTPIKHYYCIDVDGPKIKVHARVTREFTSLPSQLDSYNIIIPNLVDLNGHNIK